MTSSRKLRDPVVDEKTLEHIKLICEAITRKHVLAFVYKGAGRNAGEIGHIVVEPGGRPCHCGNRGCLEQYVSLRAAYQALGITDFDRDTPEALARRLETGDPAVEQWLRSTLDPMRKAINMMEGMLDPETIIVGGLMLLPLTEVEWEDPMSAIPAFLTVAMIPLTFSIANGLAFGITAHAVLKLLRGTANKADWFLFVLAALFVVRFAWMAGAA